jgi:hypothetical protein
MLKSSYAIRFYLKPDEYAQAEPVYFAINVLENMVAEINEAANTPTVDFLEKPLNAEALLISIRSALMRAPVWH